MWPFLNQAIERMQAEITEWNGAMKTLSVNIPAKWAALVRDTLLSRAEELRNDTTIEAFGQTVPKPDSEIKQQNRWAKALDDIANQLPTDAR